MDEHIKHIACTLWEHAHKGKRGLELEFRLGHVVGNTFLSNISRQGYDACLQYLRDSTHPTQTEMRVVTTETIQGEYRHVVTHHQDGHPPPPPFTIVKKHGFKYNIPIDNTPYVMRASLAREHPTASMPHTGAGKIVVRKKDRRRFIQGPWAYDVTQVVSNQDVDNEETYEIEVELLDTTILFEYTMDHIVRCGLSYLQDIASHIRQ